MSNWIDRANQAYSERLERDEAANKDRTARLIKLTSEFLGEEVIPLDISVPGRITVDEGGRWTIFEFADAEENSLAVVFECTFCGGDFPVRLYSIEDLGFFLNEGHPEHKKVCRNQQKG